ncbi:hypothetical protein EDB84DRAFT_961492 [Lactarius hengduanensis]|nr:hypothetical protein EDB84DRAFT_961492 [Lactarius hengduanensis]
MSSGLIDVSFYYLYKLTVYNNLFVGIVYGIYIVLYITSVHILLGKPGFTSSQPRMFMFGITTFMFVLGSIALVLEVAIGFSEIRLILDPTAENVWSVYRNNIVFAVAEAITRLMYILSDIICAWRAVVLWNRDKRVIAVLLLFIFGTTAAAVCELSLRLVPIFKSGLPFLSTIQGGTILNAGPLIMVGPTLGTNLVSTGLIAWKAWEHRISVRKHLGEGNGSVRVERVFTLLIESGFLYCCPWIIYFISAFGVIPEPGFSVMDGIVLYASGSYPTLIIILVAMQKSPIEHYSTHSTRMQFASGPALGPTRASDIVYTIRREYASDFDTHISSMAFMKTADEEKGL